MRVFPYQDGDQLIELVEKLEYDAVVLALHDMTNLLDSEKSTRNHLIKRGAELERELDDLKSQRADFGALVDKLECELNALKLLLNEVYASFADEPQSDSSWLLVDRQVTALSKIKPFLKP